MPIYEYSCRACGEETERLQKLSEPDWVDCPSCGKPELYRTVSAAGFRLSGSGWYETDFKKDGKRNISGETGSSSSSSDNSSDSGSSSAKKTADKGSSSADSISKSASSSETKSKPKPSKRSESTSAK